MVIVALQNENRTAQGNVDMDRKTAAIALLIIGGLPQLFKSRAGKRVGSEKKPYFMLSVALCI
jgi:hypothetical protein